MGITIQIRKNKTESWIDLCVQVMYYTHIRNNGVANDPAYCSQQSRQADPPDGSVMGHKGKMHHPLGWELEHYSSYGCVAYDNSSGMSLKQVVQGTVSA